MQNISIDELHGLLGKLTENDLILDVRSPAEFNEGHIEGAQNTPHEEVGAIAKDLKNYQTVYVHCKMGGRAKVASEILINSGLDNVVCVGNGGMQRWTEMGWPVAE
jgi:rhodanese-related sulfurtransferase